MKKLLIMTGVAAFAFGAFAFSNGSGFDSQNAGAFDEVAQDDNYWGTLPSDLEATVTSYSESGETAYSTRPAYFTDNNVPQTNFLAIESASAADPLVRYINESSTAGKDIGNGLYLDTLVQFTASTETMGTSEAAAKLAIWAQTSDETPEVTNFVVQAGYYTGVKHVVSTNYTMTASANFDFTAWHRLTVKAIEDIGDGIVGFVVFVDGAPLTRADPAAIGDAGFVPVLNTVAGKFANAVLPSKADYGLLDAQKLTAVSFSGNGKIDDVSFTDVAPAFAASDIVFTLYVGDGITGFTLNGTAYSDFSAGYVTLTLDPSDTTVTVGSVTYATGYKNAALSSANDGNIDGLEFTVTGDAPAATISAVRDMFTITVGGDTFGYATLADAIADAAKGTIVMVDNYTIEGAYVSVTGNVVLDLAGNTLTGPENDALFTVLSGASLTIINSAVADGCLSVNYEEGTETSEKIVVYNNGTLVIGDTSGGFVTVDGFIAEAVTKVYQGKFDVESNSDGDECAIPPEAVAEGSTLAEQAVDGYWVVDVDGDEPVEDTPVAVPTAVTGLVYDGTEKTGVEDGTGYSLTGNTGTNAGEYTATATLDDGYVWADESKEAKSITWTIAKKTVTATITLAPASATYDAEKKTVDDYTDATVTFGGDTLANTDYTVTGLDTAVAEAGEFTITVAPAASGSNYTFDTVTAKLTVTAAVPPEPVKVEPGVTAESDTEAAAKAVEFVAPAAVKTAGVNEATYAELFEQKTSYNETSGKWETTYELTAEAVADLTTEVDADVKAITPTAAEASFTGTPGIYYHTVSGTSVTALTGDDNWRMAGADGSVTLPLPQVGGTSGFYKVEASATTK